MDPNDLMLGDYILVNGNIYQVTKLTNYIHYGDNKRIGKKDLAQGVPLTRDFFIKNKFKEISSGFKLCENLLWSRNSIYAMNKDPFGFYSYLFITKCCCVHELQHLLNHCSPNIKILL